MKRLLMLGYLWAPDYGLLWMTTIFFLPPFYIFQILHNNHKSLLQLKKNVSLELGVYKCNSLSDQCQSACTFYMASSSSLFLKDGSLQTLFTNWDQMTFIVITLVPTSLSIQNDKAISIEHTLTSNFLKVITKMTMQAFHRILENHKERSKQREADC